METTTALTALAGGALIGLAASLLLVVHGRVAGVSSIFGNVLDRPSDGLWRAGFVTGMAATGAVAALAFPSAIGEPPLRLWAVALAGLLVGIGTRIGDGCTSGHGVCGLSRLSVRSLAAVMTFMVVAALTVAVVR